MKADFAAADPPTSDSYDSSILLLLAINFVYGKEMNRFRATYLKNHVLCAKFTVY